MTSHLHPVPDQLVTRQELAEIMRISIRTVDAMRHDGMPVVNWGRRRVLFRLNEAIAWAEDQQRRAA